ncbi:ABC transporter permease [Amycolatopsis sp. NBC_00348]|uniref:ABC transporter permease n=1 Tax=Amycolatopsis sp. NBC_00348 TaxID=2975956 RepID=UPI002E267C4A
MSALATKTTFGHAVHAEWVKLRSLRSTWFTLATLFVVGLGITALTANAAGKEYASATLADQQAWDPAGRSLMSYVVAQLVLGVLGILIVTAEFATGLMQTSLIATPRRHRTLAAKVVVAAAVAAVAGQALMFAAFFVGQAVFALQDAPDASLGDPGVLSAVTGGGVYLTAITLLAVGLGVLARATAGAFATLVGIVFLIPGIAGAFPGWFQGLFRYWPTLGAAEVLKTVPDPGFPHPWLNLGGLCLGVAAVLAVAFAVFRRRDV